MARYSMTDLGEVRFVHGMTVIRDYEGGILTIGQGPHVRRTLERYGMLKCSAVHTPGSGPEISTEQPEMKLLDAVGVVFYEQNEGSLQYLTQVTRFDICYAVNQLPCACAQPSTAHIGCAKHTL